MKKTLLSTVAIFAAGVNFSSATLISAIGQGGSVTEVTSTFDSTLGGPTFVMNNASDGVGGDANRWVTTAPGGYPSDYHASGPNPVLILDLASDVSLDAVAVWSYLAAAHTNSFSQFSLKFATAADGTGGFGTSITLNPTYNPAISGGQQDFAFGQVVTSRYVEVTISDNYYNPGSPASGGDRVGFSEISFNQIPEPGSFALLGLAGVGLLLRRRR